jgi:acyl carrier protein
MTPDDRPATPPAAGSAATPAAGSAATPGAGPATTPAATPSATLVAGSATTPVGGSAATPAATPPATPAATPPATPAGGSAATPGAGSADGRRALDESAVLAELRAMLARITGRPELAALAPEAGLFADGAGLDSLTGTLLLTEIRHRFDVDVAAEDLNLDALASLGTLADFLGDRRAAGL